MSYATHIEVYCMTKEEKIEKVTRDFTSLPEEKQDYILGVLQALVFANDTASEEKGHFDSVENPRSV